MAKTASNNGRKNTSQSRKTNTQGKKTTSQGRKKQTKKNVQTQADQLKNDCIILFSIACAIIMVVVPRSMPMSFCAIMKRSFLCSPVFLS